MLKNKKKRLFFILSIIILLVIGVIFFLCFDFTKFENAEEYQKKMQDYGLDLLYSNKEANKNQSVKKIEVLKIVIAATTNSNYLPGSNEEATDEQYIEYAKAKGYIIDEINLNNYNKRATYLDLINIISNAKYYVLNKDLEATVEPDFRNFDKLTKLQKQYIKDLVSNELIKNGTYSIKLDRKIKKAYVNEMVIKYIEKFNLLVYGNNTIVTNSDELPSNSEDYPYIVKEVEKKVYEQPYVENNGDDPYNSVEYFKYRKDYYESTIKTCEDYYNYLLNVNYNTIDVSTFKEKIKDLVCGQVEYSQLEKYVQYIKDNKIVLQGKATVQLPCIYDDGIDNIVRMKLEFNIINSNTRDNIIYMDLSESTKKTYNDKNIVYIDAKLGYALGTFRTFCYQLPINTMLLEMSKNDIKITE